MNEVLQRLLKDNVLHQDFTAFKGHRKCEQFGEYQSVLKRVPAGWTPSLGFGAALHEGLDVRGKWMKRKAQDLDRMRLAMDEAAESTFLVETVNLQGQRVIEPVTLPEDEYRTVGRAKDVLGLYCERWKSDEQEFEVLASEQALEKELGRALWYDENGTVQRTLVIWQGKIDGIWQSKLNGAKAFKDTKHTSQGDFETETRKHKRSGQFKGYSFLTGLREAIVDIIIVRRPVMKVTKATKPRTEFDRAYWTYTDDQIEEWRRHTLKVIGSWLTHLASGEVPMNDQACMFPSKCCYLDVCEQCSRKDRLSWLYGSDFKDNTWDPMKKQERLVMTMAEKAKIVAGEDY